MNIAQERLVEDQVREDYLADFAARLRHILHARGDLDFLSLQRGIPPYVFHEVQALRPLAGSIPIEHGGRGAEPKEILSVLEASSYESLPLGLVLAINGALFLEPLAKYGSEGLKASVFPRFVEEGAMGGLMITEPDYGTDALSMQTSFEEEGGGYAIRGTKHWAGLSGWADFWIITARRRRETGALQRDIDFFVCDSRQPGQVVSVEEWYPNLGLYMIPYGRNRVDVRVPLGARLAPVSNGLGLLRDLLHRSRMRFAGMAVGFIRRILDEAIEHCRERKVGGRILSSFDQVRRRLAEIQAGHTISAAFCRHSSEVSGIGNDLADEGLAANVHKTVLSDLMQQASQSFLQLMGAKGYRLDHLAGRAVVDSRPFQIFEGSNDVMYDQIAAAFLKRMRQIGESSLLGLLRLHELTSLAAERFTRILDFQVAGELIQRKMVDLGRIIARVVSVEFLLRLGSGGYDAGLIENAIEVLREKVGMIAAGFREGAAVPLVEDYAGARAWQACTP
ncbi:MAG TPA: acyl-CoA dehydrogenase family protein [Rectinemataceae bacterium]|nr:acyl-CoA dehydrogenase family protein [Rectinemataceae bacterium]